MPFSVPSLAAFILSTGVQLGQFNDCLAELTRAMEFSEDLKDHSHDADILGEMADAYTDLGNFEQAAKASPILSPNVWKQNVSIICSLDDLATAISVRKCWLLESQSQPQVSPSILIQFEVYETFSVSISSDQAACKTQKDRVNARLA